MKRTLKLFCSSSLLLPSVRSMVVIDSHLHVWADTAETSTYVWQPPPPANLQDSGSTAKLIAAMEANNVDGSLIVQPINHQFDHSYALNALKKHPQKFKVMMLHNPSQSTDEALATLNDLYQKGCVGVRFNPYLWPSTEEGGWEPMSQGAGLAVYQECGELGIPVGVMCFQGLELHYADILTLLETSPKTVLILDHFAFTNLAKENSKEVFDKLLDLAKYPQVHVKISALFRLGDNDETSYENVRKERFLPLLKAFGSDRLLYGSDFPFVLEQEKGYGGMVQLVSSWIENETDRVNIMGGTAEKLFGRWGITAET